MSITSLTTTFTDGARTYIFKFELPKSLSSIKAVREWASGKSNINPDLMGLGSLVSEKFIDFKHSHKKVFAITTIAFVMGFIK